jgi:hypothetical protein
MYQHWAGNAEIELVSSFNEVKMKRGKEELWL